MLKQTTIPPRAGHEPSQAAPDRPTLPPHRTLRSDRFWQRVPAYRQIDEATFLDHRWQCRHAVTRADQLRETVAGRISASFIDDVQRGLDRASMALRVSPYILALIDWDAPYDDPLRTEFIPVASRMLPDHPELGIDALSERADAPVDGLTHRYPDRALFLPLDTCPTYCRYCTRSYAVGRSTPSVSKVALTPNRDRWNRALSYVATRHEIEDVIVSGGDAYNLRPEWLSHICMTLLSIPHVRRVRIATRGLAVMPQKILTDDAWFGALTAAVTEGRARFKEVAVHTHFGHANEISAITERALRRLYSAGVVVRDQTVLLRGVNDRADVMGRLIQTLSSLHVQPADVYLHDLVWGVEDLRTTLHAGLTLQSELRGLVAGFNTPSFTVDTRGGGGKRDAHSFLAYDRGTGIAVFTAPSLKPGQCFFYFDPIDCLEPSARELWGDPGSRERMRRNVLEEAGLG